MKSAITLPSIEIGERASIGAGAVVTKSVESMVVVAGIPARKIKNCQSDQNYNEIY